MKKYFFTLAIIAALYSCGSDRCDDGYKPYNSNGHEICIPEFINGKANNFNLGNTYIHKKHGVIKLNEGVWKNELNETINVD
jgi:hypothetical protein